MDEQKCWEAVFLTITDSSVNVIFGVATISNS